MSLVKILRWSINCEWLECTGVLMKAPQHATKFCWWQNTLLCVYIIWQYMRAICFTYYQTFNIICTLVGNKTVWSLRCSWSIACRHCSNYIFIFNLTPGFNGLGKDNCKTWRETFQFWDFVHLIIQVCLFTTCSDSPFCILGQIRLDGDE